MFVFQVTGCQRNGLLVHWDIFHTNGASEFGTVSTMGGPLMERILGFTVLKPNEKMFLRLKYVNNILLWTVPFLF